MNISISKFFEAREQLYLDSNSFVRKRVKTNLSRLIFKASNASFITYSVFFSLCCKSTYVMQYVVSNGEITEITRVRFSSRLHNFHQIVIKLCVCWLISRGLFALNTSESGLGSVWLLTRREQYFNRVCQTFVNLKLIYFEQISLQNIWTCRAVV